MKFITQYLTYILIVAAFIVGFIVSLLVANGAKLGDALGKMWVYLGKANSEDNGHPSSTRLNVFFALSQWSLVISFGFILVVLFYGSLILAYLGILAGLVAGLLGLKILQKPKEELTNETQKVDVPVAPSTATQYPDGTIKTVTEEVKP